MVKWFEEVKVLISCLNEWSLRVNSCLFNSCKSPSVYTESHLWESRVFINCFEQVVLYLLEGIGALLQKLYMLSKR